MLLATLLKLMPVPHSFENRNSYPVGKTTEPIYKNGGTIKIPRKGFTEGLVLSVTGVTGEKRRFANGRDSGQSNSDIT
jgi:hypothetical protein